MDRIIFFSIYVCGLIFVLSHSYYRRGPALTFNFFFFAFILIFSKSGWPILKPMQLESFGQPAMFYRAFFASLWVILFYLSWSIAEGLVKVIGYFRGKVFPVLLFSVIVMAVILRALRVHSSDVGQEVCFFLYFQTAYLLVTQSKYKAKDYKGVFFALPFLYNWIKLFSGENHLNLFVAGSLFLLVILAFASPLTFDYSGVKRSRS